MCQEFGLAPDVAERQDLALCKRIMALRSYAHAKAEADAGVEQKHMTSDPKMLEKVVEITVKRARGEI